MDNKSSHIPTEEVLQDIADTQKEIDQYKAELEALERNPVENKLPIYMRQGKISTRENFIIKLNKILELRNENKLNR